MSQLNDLFKPNFKTVEPENNERVLRNGLLFPIEKAFLETHPQYFNTVRSYEHAVESIPGMIETDKDSTIDTVLEIDDNRALCFKLKIANARLVEPGTIDACDINPAHNILEPNTALAKQGTYCLSLTGDVEYEYKIVKREKSSKDFLKEIIDYSKQMESGLEKRLIKNALITSFPLMLGSKWDTLRKYDLGTLIRSGEESEGLYGTFVVKGYHRHLIPSLKKPLNKAIVLHNDYDEQLSRCEIQYSKGSDYEHSYFMVGAMLKENSVRVSPERRFIKAHDFGFSLQFNHSSMNQTSSLGKNTKKLINFVPIKILFAAFGCVSDRDLINYICPNHDDIALITCIRQAILYGYKHHEAYVNANIDIDTMKYNYVKVKETITPMIAKYIIGCAIMKEDKLNELNKKANGDEIKYRQYVALNVNNILNERFMPAVQGSANRNVAICITLGNIVSELYYVGQNLHASQSKQSLINKRVRLGTMVSKEFKSYWGVRLNKELLPEIRRILESSTKDNFDEILNQTIKQQFKKISINQTTSMIQAFCGNGSELSKIRNDIVEPKNQLFIWNKENEIAKSSDLQGKTVNASWENRRPHPSELYFICPTEMPDGANVGKFRALGIHCIITNSESEGPIRKLLSEDKRVHEMITSEKIKDYYSIVINGSIVGYIHEFEDVEALYEELMEKRSQSKISNEISVVLNHMKGELVISTDNGRILCPFVIVKNCFVIDNEKNKITIKPEFEKWLQKCDKEIDAFDEGLTGRFIEYLDCEMTAYNAVIAGGIRDFYADPNKFTHVAMNESVNGIIAAVNPGTNINAPVRAGMSTNHVKQAMGAPLYKYPMLKFQNLLDMLISPQQPLVQPAVQKYLHLDQCAIGQNLTICFIHYKYNQEDSIIINQESINNGTLKCETFSTIRDECVLTEDKYEIPNKDVVKKLSGNVFSYDKISDLTCLPKDISTKFNKGDVLIGKIRKAETGIADISVVNKMPDANDTWNPRPLRCVEKHYICDKTKNVKLLCTGQYRTLIQGDKVNAEHCQKATVGRIVSAENLPYTSSGHVADLYFNPMSVFKRKTYGMVYVSTLAKIAALYGCILESSGYGTIRTPDEVVKLFENLGLDVRGFETMFDPETGEKIGSGIFFGIGFYERQHHMVESKINVRCFGGHDANTGMPVQGRARNGGLSFDRLSVSALCSSGSNGINLDYHLNQCSKTQVGFCKICHSTMCYRVSNTTRGESGHVISRYDDVGEWYCPKCGKHDNIDVRYVSKAFPLMNHVFNALTIRLNHKD